MLLLLLVLEEPRVVCQFEVRREIPTIFALSPLSSQRSTFHIQLTRSVSVLEGILPHSVFLSSFFLLFFCCWSVLATVVVVVVCSGQARVVSLHLLPLLIMDSLFCICGGKVVARRVCKGRARTQSDSLRGEADPDANPFRHLVRSEVPGFSFP